MGRIKRKTIPFKTQNSHQQERFVFLRYYYTEQRLKVFNLLSTRIPVHIIYYQSPQVENRKWKLDPKKVKFTYTELNLKKVGPFVVGNPFKIAKLIKPTDKVVFINNYPINFINLLVAIILKIRNVKILLWNEDIPFPQINASLVNRLSKWIMSFLLLLFFKDIIALGDIPGKQYLKGRTFGPKNIIKAPNAILSIEDINKYKPVPPPRNNKLTLGYLGYFRQTKNLPFLLKFVSKHPEINLILAGDGLTKYIVQNFSQTYKNIEYIGYIKTLKQKIEFLKKIHFLILPSVHEVWGLVVNEAVYYGVPAIVSNRVGSQELVKELNPNLIFKIFVKRNILKFKGKISPEEIDKVILPQTYEELQRVINYAKKLIQNKTNYLKLKEKAREIGQRYSADHLANKLYDWFIKN